MTTGMIGRKLGMMRVFDGSGRVRGVTVIELGPNYVTRTARCSWRSPATGSA